MQHHTNCPATIPAADAPRDLIEHQDRIAYQLSAIVQAHAAFLVFDPGGVRAVQTSANIRAILGAQPEDALGRRPDELFNQPSAGVRPPCAPTTPPTPPSSPVSTPATRARSSPASTSQAP